MTYWLCWAARARRPADQQLTFGQPSPGGWRRRSTRRLALGGVRGLAYEHNTASCAASCAVSCASCANCANCASWAREMAARIKAVQAAALRVAASGLLSRRALRHSTLGRTRVGHAARRAGRAGQCTTFSCSPARLLGCSAQDVLPRRTTFRFDVLDVLDLLDVLDVLLGAVPFPRRVRVRPETCSMRSTA